MRMGHNCSTSNHNGVCGHCHSSPCCCGGFLMGAVAKTMQLGLGMMSALKSCGMPQCDTGWCRIPCDTQIVVHALPGERRIVPYQVRNDTQCPVRVTPELSPWGSCGCEDQTTGIKGVLEPAGPFELEACGAVNFDILIDTAGLKPCHCYCATLTLKGVCCDPVVIALCIGGKIPAVCRHDNSSLRAWVRESCFRKWGPQYVAPAPLGGHCKDC